MAFPNSGALATTIYAAPFRSPRDRRVTNYAVWERGGIAIQDPTEGLDVYDWLFEADRDTGVMTATAYDEVGAVAVAATALYTIDPLPKQIAGSFDTNMNPILAWRDADGNAFFRWYDPVSEQFEVVALGARTHSIRLALDDVRDPFPTLGVTDTILAYVRRNTVYYRQLRDRFDTEYTIGLGFPELYQIGLTELLRFQFARSPEEPDGPSQLSYLTPEVRVSKIAAFDDFGDAVLADFVDSGIVGEIGLSAQVDKDIASTGQTFFVRLDDGSWPTTSVVVTVDFYEENTFLRASREFTFSIDTQGNITRAVTDGDGEGSIAVVEVGAGSPTYTATVVALENGQGVTFNLVALAAAPSSGVFLPAWNDSNFRDFAGGGLVPTGSIQYTDYGTHVSLRAADAEGYTARSASTRLRWGVGSLPVPLRPATTRSVPCVVSRDGVTVSGLAEFYPNGSAEFWPLVDSSGLLVKGAFLKTDTVKREKGLSADWQLTYVKAFTSDFDPVPTLSSISPDTEARFASDLLITLTGADFQSDSFARFNETPLVTTFNSDTELEATIPAALMTAAGTFDVDVFTPVPGGGLSTAETFSVTNPTPVIVSIDPTVVEGDSGDFLLTVTGTDFVPESVIEWGGASQTTTYVNSTTLTATISNSLIQSPGTVAITVTSPTPGGGTSNSVNISVQALYFLIFEGSYTPPSADDVDLIFTE